MVIITHPEISVVDPFDARSRKILGSRASNIVLDQDDGRAVAAVKISSVGELVEITPPTHDQEITESMIIVLPSCGVNIKPEIETVALLSVNKHQVLVFQWMSTDGVKLAMYANGLLINNKYFVQSSLY